LIGSEFAGRRSDTGERVFGFCLGRGIATFVDCAENMMTTIPDHWSMAESVTLLTTYCTVWYGLIDKAQLMKSKYIFIQNC
jgi:NADPH:quinone reductase-like Zn-dependent oxidoreductase